MPTTALARPSPRINQDALAELKTPVRKKLSLKDILEPFGDAFRDPEMNYAALSDSIILQIRGRSPRHYRRLKLELKLLAKLPDDVSEIPSRSALKSVLEASWKIANHSKDVARKSNFKASLIVHLDGAFKRRKDARAEAVSLLGKMSGMLSVEKINYPLLADAMLTVIKNSNKNVYWELVPELKNFKAQDKNLPKRIPENGVLKDVLSKAWLLADHPPGVINKHTYMVNLAERLAHSMSIRSARV